MKRKLTALIAGMLFLAVVLVCAELFFSYLVRKGKSFSFELQEDETNNVSWPGSKVGLSPPSPPSIPKDQRYLKNFLPYPKESLHFRVKGRNIRLIPGRRLVFNVSEVKDERGRRIVPAEDKKDARMYLNMIGDSVIFGLGVNDHETLPAMVGKEFPEYRVYNYGFVAHYPGEILDRIRAITPEELPEKKGVSLYFLADYQIMRNIGAISELGRWQFHKHRYHENELGQIVRGKLWEEERPMWTRFARWAGRSGFIQYFGLDLRPGPADYRFQLRVLQNMEKELKKRSSEKLIIVFLPDQHPRLVENMLPLLEEAKMEYINLSHWRSSLIVPGKTRIDYDGHPTAAYHAVIGKELSKFIRFLLARE